MYTNEVEACSMVVALCAGERWCQDAASIE